MPAIDPTQVIIDDGGGSGSSTSSNDITQYKINGTDLGNMLETRTNAVYATLTNYKKNGTAIKYVPATSLEQDITNQNSYMCGIKLNNYFKYNNTNSWAVLPGYCPLNNTGNIITDIHYASTDSTFSSTHEARLKFIRTNDSTLSLYYQTKNETDSSWSSWTLLKNLSNKYYNYPQNIVPKVIFVEIQAAGSDGASGVIDGSGKFSWAGSGGGGGGYWAGTISTEANSYESANNLIIYLHNNYRTRYAQKKCAIQALYNNYYTDLVTINNGHMYNGGVVSRVSPATGDPRFNLAKIWTAYTENGAGGSDKYDNEGSDIASASFNFNSDTSYASATSHSLTSYTGGTRGVGGRADVRGGGGGASHFGNGGNGGNGVEKGQREGFNGNGFGAGGGGGSANPLAAGIYAGGAGGGWYIRIWY